MTDPKQPICKETEKFLLHEAVDFLNRLADKEPAALEWIFNQRTHVQSAHAVLDREVPTLVVRPDNDESLTMSALGLINGLLGRMFGHLVVAHIEDSDTPKVRVRFSVRAIGSEVPRRPQL